MKTKLFVAIAMAAMLVAGTAGANPIGPVVGSGGFGEVPFDVNDFGGNGIEQGQETWTSYYWPGADDPFLNMAMSATGRYSQIDVNGTAAGAYADAPIAG